MDSPRVVPCTHCGSEGRLYSGHANDPNPLDCGECPVCKGTGGEIIETEPIELQDMDRENCPVCQARPFLFPCFDQECPFPGTRAVTTGGLNNACNAQRD